jgi:hypothetical protein
MMPPEDELKRHDALSLYGANCFRKSLGVRGTQTVLNSSFKHHNLLGQP